MLETADRKLKTFAVLDTNVVVSIIKDHDKNSSVYQMGQLIEKGNIVPLFDERLISEYYAVLKHAKLNLHPELIDEYMTMFLVHGTRVQDVERVAVLLYEAGVSVYRVTMSILESDSGSLADGTAHYPEDFDMSPGLLLKAMNYIEKFCNLTDEDINNYVQNVLKKIREIEESYYEKGVHGYERKTLQDV